jgi:hypothetical protein
MGDVITRGLKVTGKSGSDPQNEKSLARLSTASIDCPLVAGVGKDLRLE